MDINMVNSATLAPTKVDVDHAATKPSQQDVELDTRSAINAVEAAEEIPAAQAEPEHLQGVVDELSDMMSLMRKGLAFKIDEDSGTNIVSVMDIDSGDIIRQIPNEEALELAQKLSEVTGLLMKTEV
ncbi:flagellar protein FlaG [Shewanella algidipiscicola]|uniref:flagellar protein FlaG n=1 Tax=Shewanella algidipiscicola TaxID=614070 RepID=UPI000D785A13|nr:flagellar protein FlaG [Shewanella algidipiscicola]